MSPANYMYTHNIPFTRQPVKFNMRWFPRLQLVGLRRNTKESTEKWRIHQIFETVKSLSGFFPLLCWFNQLSSIRCNENLKPCTDKCLFYWYHMQNSFMLLSYPRAISLDLPFIAVIAATTRVNAILFVFTELFTHWLFTARSSVIVLVLPLSLLFHDYAFPSGFTVTRFLMVRALVPRGRFQALIARQTFPFV